MNLDWQNDVIINSYIMAPPYVLDPVYAPTGRLTLTTATPVQVSALAGATTIYYTPYIGAMVPIYDGSLFVMTAFTELSQATTDATKSPAAVAANSNYDLFVWDDGGTIRCTRGPAWSSDTARGTGAGTTELTRVQGYYVNAVAITNGPGANLGTYVGSVRSNASSQIAFNIGTTDTSIDFSVWNMYNRVPYVGYVPSSINSFTMVTNSVRSWNNSDVHRARFISGLAEDIFVAEGYGVSNTGTTVNRSTGLGLGYDSTTAISGIFIVSSVTLSARMSNSIYKNRALGHHFVQALEVSQTNTNNVGYGDANVPTRIQSGLNFQFMM